MILRKLLLSKILIICLVFSCRKDHLNSDNVIHRSPDTPGAVNKEKKIVAFNKEVANVLMQVYKNDSALIEVNATIYCGYYADERVLLKDLLNPASSGLYRSDKFLRLKTDTGIFRRTFCEIIEKNPYPLINDFLSELNTKRTNPKASVSEDYNYQGEDFFSDEMAPAIYFPYSENFFGSNEVEDLSVESLALMERPVIVSSDREADSGIGMEPYLCGGFDEEICYREVVVDDNFVGLRNTHIVTGGATHLSEAESEQPAQATATSRVYTGWSRLTKQMDKLISLTGNGGGSEIRVGRVSGYLKTENEQVENFTGDMVMLFFTRGEISNGRWKRVYSIWDPNWNYQDAEQIYAVYEDDTRGEKSFSGSLNTAVNIPGKPSPGNAKGEVSYKITIPTQDEIILQRKLDRASFFRAGNIDQGNGFIEDDDDFLSGNQDWPIYDGGAVWGYTMPNQIY